MTSKSLYERVLETVAGGAGLPAARPPRASSAVVPWRSDESGDVEVFWMRRAETLPFMAGWHAFPGGGMSKHDADLPIEGRPQGVDEAPADGGMPPSVVGDLELGPIAPPGLVACALRELFEETGLLLCSAEDEWHLEEWTAALNDRLAAGVRFGPAVEELDIRLDASRLVYAGRWLTPPLGPLRFDNRFFLLEWSNDREAQPFAASSESAEVEWIRPEEALERWGRGEVIAAPPILHLLRVLAEDGPEAGLPRLVHAGETNLGPHRCIEFQPGVVLLPLPTPTLPPATHTNCYLLGSGEAVLVDPGSPFEGEIGSLVAAVEAAAKQGRHVQAIWLTHHHPDHVGGVQAVRAALGVPVLAHAATAERLEPLGIEIDEMLEDGQAIRLAGDPELHLRVLHTPGHASGHLCFHEERLGWVICGDLISTLSTIVIDPPEGDMDAYLESLERVADLEPRTLFPAHGGTERAAVPKLREFVDHRLWREGRILEAWTAGIRDRQELVERVYDDAPVIARPLAARQLEAHLDRLALHGRLDEPTAG